MSAVEPVVGVVALRTFRVSMNGYLVPATQYSNEWATGAAIARCSGFHQAPADDCSCGLYSMNDVHQLRTQYQQARRLVAVVALEGQYQGLAIPSRPGTGHLDRSPRGPRPPTPATPAASARRAVPHRPRRHAVPVPGTDRAPAAPPRRARRGLPRHPGPRCPGPGHPEHGRRVGGGHRAAGRCAGPARHPAAPPGIVGGTGQHRAGAVAAVAAVAAEAPGQLLILAIRGGTMPLLLAPRRPVKHLFRAGGSVLAGGAIAAALTGHPINVGGVAVTLGWWLPLLLTETFLCALHRSTRPVSVPVLMGIRPRGHRAVRTGWEPAHHRDGGRTLRDPHPLRRHLLVPINIIPATGA